jgi:NAD(P)-dependent dehydrogenase (short-subunit alcohol dehydrogenase family)
VVRAAGRKLFDASAETTLLGRAAEPQEIADLIGFLASPALRTSREPISRSTAAAPPPASPAH